MAEEVTISTTPHCAALLRSVLESHAQFGGVVMGTEHLLEALLRAESGVAHDILDATGSRVPLESALGDYWSRPMRSSVILVDDDGVAERTPDGLVLQVALIADTPRAPRRAELDNNGKPIVFVSGLDGQTRPVPMTPDLERKVALRLRQAGSRHAPPFGP